MSIFFKKDSPTIHIHQAGRSTRDRKSGYLPRQKKKKEKQKNGFSQESSPIQLYENKKRVSPLSNQLTLLFFSIIDAFLLTKTKFLSLPVFQSNDVTVPHPSFLNTFLWSLNTLAYKMY